MLLRISDDRWYNVIIAVYNFSGVFIFMPQRPQYSETAIAQQGNRSYGWVVVVACAVMLGITYGLMYSYSVFFKPLADTFNWDRATVSLIYSASMVIRGAISIGTGYLADRYGASKIMVVCSLLIGLGLVLSSRAHYLWQFFLTYAVIEAIGLSGTFGIGTAIVARWFTKNRGLALGIVSSGSGLGTLLIVPGTERLIDAVEWPQAFLICGIVAGVVMTGAALLLRQPPDAGIPLPHNHNVPEGKETDRAPDATVGQALKDPRMMLLMAAFLFFFFSIQIVMVHLVNYATDIHVSPLVAASFISVIGGASIASRLSIGAWSDRIGIHNSLILTRIFLVIAYICLIFTRPLWSFYVFAVLFSIPYGGEIPQIPLYIGKYFGTKSMATLVGLNVFVITIGGAIGPWLAGTIFDSTDSYRPAFIVGTAAALISLGLLIVLRRHDQKA
jgi:MFS family permease